MDEYDVCGVYREVEDDDVLKLSGLISWEATGTIRSWKDFYCFLR